MALSFEEAKEAIQGTVSPMDTPGIEKWVKKNCQHLSDREQYLVIEAARGIDARTPKEKAAVVEDAAQRALAEKKAEDEARAAAAAKAEATKAAKEARRAEKAEEAKEAAARAVKDSK